MLIENNLTKYYSGIAEKLDEIIPMKWEKIVMYAEELGGVSSASFYFYTNSGEGIHYSGDIPEEFSVSINIFIKLLGELCLCVKVLWDEFNQ